MSDMSNLDPTVEHGGVTDEDIAAFFETHPGLRPLNPLNGADPSLPVQFHSGDGRVMPPTTDDDIDLDAIPATGTEGEPPEPTSPAEPLTTPEAEGDDADGAITPPPASEPVQFVEFNGVQIPVAQLEGLLSLQQTILGDDQLRDLISGHLVGRVAPVEGGAPTTAAAPVTSPSVAGVQPPPDLDLDDPSIAGLWAIVQQQNAQIAQLSAGVQTTYTAHMANERANAESTYRRAAHDFKQQHELNDDEVKTLSDIAARLNVVPSLLRGVDPLTGMPVRPDPLSAINRALEIAYFMDPSFREREFQRSVKQQQTDSKRKKNLAAVGASAGSVSRTTTPPRPGTPEAKQAMLAEVGQMMTGEWTGDN